MAVMSGLPRTTAGERSGKRAVAAKELESTMEFSKNQTATNQTGPRISLWRAYAYAWITLGLFLFSLLGHWIFGWFAYVDEQLAHGQPIEVAGYAVLMARDTLENWQSEFLQLLWQVGGLAFFLYLGSPQSREGDERKEAKLDAILRRLDPAEGDAVIERLDREFPRR
jgi:hypothetical protein